MSTLLHQAERLGDSLPPLVIAALAAARAVVWGHHGRRRSGPGDMFFQYRPARDGEDRTRIDWRASARTEKLFVREKEWQVAQTVWLWVDPSPSMDFKSRADLPTKRERAQLLGLACATLLMRGDERVATLDGQVPPTQSADALVRLHAAFARNGGSLPPLAHVGNRSHVLLVGDILPDAPAVAAWAEHLSAHGAALSVVEVSDPVEETFPFKGPTVFEGLEGEGDLLTADPRKLRADYLALRARTRASLVTLCRRSGGVYLPHVTSATAEDPLRRLHAHLHAERGVR